MSANKKFMEEFDNDIYRMCSPNNMPLINEFEPLSEEEVKQLESALKVNKSNKNIRLA